MAPKCELFREITDELTINELWNVYFNSFAGQETECAQNQICFNRDEFAAALADPDWEKFVLTDEDGKFIGLGASTTNLEKARVGYINPEAFAKRLPGYEGRIFYIPIIAILPEFQRKKFFYPFMSRMYRHVIFDMRGVSAYDFSQNKNPHLQEIIAHVGEEMIRRGEAPAGARIVSHRFDAQIYGSTQVIWDD